MELDILKQSLQEKHKLVIYEIDKKLDKLFDDLLGELNQFSLNSFDIERLFKENDKKVTNSSVQNGSAKGKAAIEHQPVRTRLPEKVFAPRNSLLTDLFEVKHFKAIYHIFGVILLILFLNTLITDFLSAGKINIGLKPIFTGFSGIHYAIVIWISMQLITMAVHPVFLFWAHCYRNYFMTGQFQFLSKLWNFFWLLAVIAYQVLFIMEFTKIINSVHLMPASAIAVFMELVRLMMKSHAYIRTNVPRVFNSKNKLKVDDEVPDTNDTNVNKNSNFSNGTSKVQDKRIVPTFKMYVYFLFAPTLIYRDQYPRTKYIRWGFVIRKLLEMFAIIFMLSFVFERVMNPKYRQYGTMQEVDVEKLFVSIFNCMMPGLLCFVCSFYCVLHSWLNATAEMLRFADRMFYKDWWNSTSFAVYYRTWNVVVHDWLYTYVYKDLFEVILNGNRYICQIIVFTLSALVHEYILANTFKFCYPVLFIMFEGFSVLLVFLTRKEHRAFGNILMWFSVSFGIGILLALYHIEYYARLNCQNDNKEWWDFYVPLSWRCTMLKYNTDWKIQIHL